MAYKFYTDGGHGWLQVPKEQIRQLGIEAQISGHSYHDKDNVYLEEDCDMAVFLKKKGITSPAGYQVFHQQVEEVYHHNSPIRNLPHYTRKSLSHT